MTKDNRMNKKFQDSFMFFRFVLFIVIGIYISGISQTTFRWDGNAVDKTDWTAAANWVDIGPGTDAGVVGIPDAGDNVIFNGTHTNVPGALINIPTSSRIGNFSINGAAYTVTVGTSLYMDGNLTITTGGLDLNDYDIYTLASSGTNLVNGGTLTLGSGSGHLFNSALSITDGGTFNGNSSNISLYSSFSFSDGAGTSTLNMGTSTIEFVAGNAQINTDQSITLHNVTLNSASTNLNFNGTTGTPVITINGNLLLKNYFFLLNVVSLTGGVSLSYGSNATVTYDKASGITTSAEWTSSLNVPNVVLQSGTVTIASGTRTVDNKLTRINGSISGTVAYNSGNTTTLEYAPSPAANVTIGNEWPSGGPDNVTVSNSGFAVTGTTGRLLSKTLTVFAGTLSLGSNDLTVLGDVVGDVAGTGTIHDNTTLVMGDRTTPVNSTQDQTISGSIGLNKLLINKTGGTDDRVTVSGTLNFSASGNITVTNGNLTLTEDGKLGSANLGTLTLNVSSGGIVETGGQNLSTIGTLSASSGTIVFNGSGVSETLPAGFTIGTVTVDNTAGVAIESGTLTVANTLNLTNGRITTSESNTLLLQSTATITGGSSSNMIVGPLQKAFLTGNTPAFTYPVGFGTSYRPAIFDYSANSAGDGSSIIEIEAVSGDPGGAAPNGISQVSTSHYYTVNEVGTGGTIDYTITLTHTGTTFTTSRIRILRQTASGPTYEYDSVNNGTPTATIQTLSNQTALPDQSNGSIFAFGTIPGVVSWDGGGDDDNWETALNWSTDTQPGSSDDVVIDVSGGVTVTLSGTSQKSIKSLTLGNGADSPVTLSITNTNDIPITISGSGAFLQIAGEGILTVNGTTGGLSVSGNMTLDAGAVYNILTGTGTAVSGTRNFAATSETNISSSSNALKASGYGILNITSDQSITGNVSAVNLDVDGDGTDVLITGDLSVSSTLTTSHANSSITVTGTGANYAVTGTTSNAGTMTVNGTGFSSFTGEVTSNGSFVVTGTSGNVSFVNFRNYGTMTLSNANDVSFSGRYIGTGTVDGSSGAGLITISLFKPYNSVDFSAHTVSITDSFYVSNGTYTPGNTSYSGPRLYVVPPGVLASGSGKIIFTGTLGQQIRGFNITFNDLEINKSANSVFTYENTTVTGTLTMTNGNLIVGSLNDAVILSNSVSGGSNSSYLASNGAGIGPVIVTGTTSLVTVPLGQDNADGFMRSIGIQPANAGSEFELYFYHTASSNGGTVGDGILDHVSDKYYWTVARTGTVADAAVTLHWGPNGTVEDGVGTTADGYLDLHVAYYDDVTDNRWESIGNNSITGSDDQGSVTSDGLAIGTAAEEFTLGSSSSDNSLPVELSSFSVNNSIDGVELNWSVESELDNQAFIIDRRIKDANNSFETIAEIEGRGTASSSMEYSYLDRLVTNGEVYEYRLRSRDYSGLVHIYSNSIAEISVELVPEGFTLEQNYPNPFNPTTTIRFSLSQPAKVMLSIYDITGKEVSRLVNNENLETNNYNYVWNGKNQSGRQMASGVYFYRMIVNSGQQIMTKKMILVK